VWSTTKRTGERGQILAIFALSAVTLIIVAALAFDGGLVLLERRDQQDAADAAALAGARFLPGDTVKAVSRATEIARLNGFEDGTASVNVDIAIGSWTPGGSFVAGGGTGAIRVQIGSTRASIMAGIIGRTSWDVSSQAVAVNQTITSGPFAMLSLHPTQCRAMDINGTGRIVSAGNLQVNSQCTTGQGAFVVGGSGTIDLVAPDVGCNVVGGGTIGNNSTVSPGCNPPNEEALALPDPYLNLPDPPEPELAPDMVLSDPVTGAAIVPATEPPSGCPGSADPATRVDPHLCKFAGSNAGQTWRIYPGYYSGGLDLGASTNNPARFLLEPGVYYIGGGGFNGANSVLTSVDPGGLTLGGGVLIFNTTLPNGSGAGPVTLNGGTAGLSLYPLDGAGVYAPYDRMVIYQDRDVALDVTINGGSSDMQVRGLIYAPAAQIRVNGSTGTITVDQIIASTFNVNGSDGTINVAQDAGFLPELNLAGLVE
jgi:Flp pilus assembly protein TadG